MSAKRRQRGRRRTRREGDVAGRSKEGGASYVHVFILGTEGGICRP